MEPIIDIQLLETDEGKVPFKEWYDSLKDKVTKVRVRRRLDRIELGNFGDTESVGEGVYELIGLMAIFKPIKQIYKKSKC